MSIHPGLRAQSILLRTSRTSARDEEVAVYASDSVPSDGTLPDGQELGASQPALCIVGGSIIPTTDGGTTWGHDIHDPGDGNAIPVTHDGVCAITTAGAETRTLAIPSYIGQRISLALDTDGGDCTVTVASAVNQAGNNTLVAADAGDHIALEAITVGGTLAWRVLANDGWALSTV